MSAVVLAGTGENGQVYRSTDGGQSWSLAQRLGSASPSHVYSLLDLGDGVVLAGTDPNAQVYRSTDGGQSWRRVGRLGKERQVWSLADLGGGGVHAGAGTH